MKIIRSDRKTLSVKVTGDGIVVRAPRRVTDAQIEAFLSQNREWIRRQTEKQEAQRNAVAAQGGLGMEQIRALADEALKVIPERVRFYAAKIGVTYGRITIRNQRTRWGSCTARGDLNFNCLLMLTPPEVLDSVVVHELCHRKEMNHSEQFYAEVLRVFPDYFACHRWLKENGGVLMARMCSAEPDE